MVLEVPEILCSPSKHTAATDCGVLVPSNDPVPPHAGGDSA